MKRFALALVLVAAACGSSNNNNTTADSPVSTGPVKSVSCTGATLAQTVTVVATASSFMFSPDPITIHVNDIVRFNTSAVHPVASGTPSSPDGKFSTTGDGCFQFTQAGTFPYFCSVHLFTGSVTVQ